MYFFSSAFVGQISYMQNPIYFREKSNVHPFGRLHCHLSRLMRSLQQIFEFLHTPPELTQLREQHSIKCKLSTSRLYRKLLLRPFNWSHIIGQT